VAEDTAGRAVDRNVAVDEAWVASVRRSGRLVVLVGRDGVTARRDESRHVASSAGSGGSPVVRHRAVVVLLVALVVHRLGVLGGVWRVHSGRLGGGGSVGVRVHVLSGDSVRHVCGDRHSAELASGVRHHGVLVLGREGLAGDVHALEAMSKSGHVGWAVVHAVCSSDLASSAVLVAIAHVGVAVAHVGPRVPVLALVVVVGHGRHLRRGN
jgi:hypothetical protein